MPEIVADNTPTDKDLRERSPVPPSPGLLSSFIQHGRPVYRPAPGVAVPRLERVPAAEGFLVTPVQLCDYRRAPEAVLRPRVVTWLDQPAAQATRAHTLDSLDLAQLTALAAAALLDVAGVSRAAVCEWMESPAISNERRRAILAGVPSDDPGDLRSTGRQIARGRDLWVRIAAWPWWPVVDAGEGVAGGMPAQWWELPRVHESLAAWTAIEPEPAAFVLRSA